MMFEYFYKDSEVSQQFLETIKGVEKIDCASFCHNEDISIVYYDKLIKTRIVVDREKMVFYSEDHISDYEMVLIILEINSQIVSEI